MSSGSSSFAPRKNACFRGAEFAYFHGAKTTIGERLAITALHPLKAGQPVARALRLAVNSRDRKMQRIAPNAGP